MRKEKSGHQYANDVVAITPQRDYILPHPALRRLISHYTVYKPETNGGGSGQPEYLNIVPDASGCLVCSMIPKKVELRFWGPSSEVSVVENNPSERPLMFFVEFRPGGAGRLLNNMPMPDFHNRMAWVDDVDKTLAGRLRDGCERFCMEKRRPDISALLSDVDRFFLDRLQQSDESYLFLNVLSEIYNSAGRLRIGEISKIVRYSERHVNRIMSERLGVSPKLLARIIRINHACDRLQKQNYSLTRLAHDLDYHDQSHFIHDFTAVCGLSPDQYRRKMSDFYNEGQKLGGNMSGT